MAAFSNATIPSPTRIPMFPDFRLTILRMGVPSVIVLSIQRFPQPSMPPYLKTTLFRIVLFAPLVRMRMYLQSFGDGALLSEARFVFPPAVASRYDVNTMGSPPLASAMRVPSTRKYRPEFNLILTPGSILSDWPLRTPHPGVFSISAYVPGSIPGGTENFRVSDKLSLL